MSQSVHVVIIGEKGEYGRRLVRYLEKRTGPHVRIYHFTEPSRMEGCEPGDLYILDDCFCEAVLSAACPGHMPDSDQILHLTDREGEGFCRFCSPARILDRIIQAKEKGRDLFQDRDCVQIRALYSPVFEEHLEEIAAASLEEGDLYIGMEDIGPVVGEHANMGDLCYYIRLREEEILDILEEIAERKEGIFILSSPDLFFYLRELKADDYRWFFDRLRSGGRYRHITAGIGSGFLTGPEVFSLFDEIWLLDSAGNSRVHSLCQRLEWAAGEAGAGFRGKIRIVTREEMSGYGDEQKEKRTAGEGSHADCRPRSSG